MAASDPITQREVHSRTTLVGLDGRVIERPDGNYLLVDAYNVLQRDFEKLTAEKERLDEECADLKRQMRQKELKYETDGAVHNAEAASRLQTLGDEVTKLASQVAKLEQENAGLHATSEVVGSFRLSIGEAVKRLFRTAAGDVQGELEAVGSGQSGDMAALTADPFFYSSSAQPSLHNELKLLQRAKDRLLIILTTAATSHRQTEGGAAKLTHELQVASLSAQQQRVFADESTKRAEYVFDYQDSVCEFAAVLTKNVASSSSSPSARLQPHSGGASTTPEGSPRDQIVFPLSSTLNTYDSFADGQLSSDRLVKRESSRGVSTPKGHRERESKLESKLHHTAGKASKTGNHPQPAFRQESGNLSASHKRNSRPKKGASALHNVLSPRRMISGSAPAPSFKDIEADTFGLSIEVGGKVAASHIDAICPGDVLVSCDGKAIATQQDLVTIASASPSGSLTCRVRRNGVMKTVEVKLKQTGPPEKANPRSSTTIRKKGTSGSSKTTKAAKACRPSNAATLK
ncbi:hypothetical protein DIPPA_17089 [Diplonema papillatum]|nr:hypothetical protein DIPPA_17089 [Diplonema papillatum]